MDWKININAINKKIVGENIRDVRKWSDAIFQMLSVSIVFTTMTNCAVENCGIHCEYRLCTDFLLLKKGNAIKIFEAFL